MTGASSTPMAELGRVGEQVDPARMGHGRRVEAGRARGPDGVGRPGEEPEEEGAVAAAAGRGRGRVGGPHVPPQHQGDQQIADGRGEQVAAAVAARRSRPRPPARPRRSGGPAAVAGPRSVRPGPAHRPAEHAGGHRPGRGSAADSAGGAAGEGDRGIGTGAAARHRRPHPGRVRRRSAPTPMAAVRSPTA